MTEKTYWQSCKAEGANIIDRLKELIHEGNVRRVVIQQQGRTVAEFPLTAGVVGAVLAPVLAAIGALVALLNDCSIQVERVETGRTEQRPTRTDVM
jgi:D-aminopeptidase